MVASRAAAATMCRVGMYCVGEKKYITPQYSIEGQAPYLPPLVLKPRLYLLLGLVSGGLIDSCMPLVSP